MPHVQVRDVPDDVHAALVHKAQAAGLSLQQYLNAELRRLAVTPTMEEVLDRLERDVSGRLTARQAADTLARDRDRR